MATAGVGAGVNNSQENCSVCLEPFKGRQPKLLPCYHTFCLPCLTRLADGDEAQQGTNASGGEGDKPAVSISCPTCRCAIPVPPGGVTNFQTNSYLGDSDMEDNSRPIPCDLCNGEEEAQYQCRECHNSFCPHCRHYHDKVCQRAQVTELQNLSDIGSTTRGPTSSQVRQQLKMVEDCLKKLREDKEKLAQEREGMENSVHLRYATLLRHVSEAQNTCLTNLRQVCDTLAKRLDTHMAEAQKSVNSLQQQLSGSQPASISQAQQRATQFIQGDLQTILNSTSSSAASLLRHEVKDNIPHLADCLQLFMGKIVEFSEVPDNVQASEAHKSLDLHCNQEAVSSAEPVTSTQPGPDAKAWKELSQKVGDMASQVSSLQSANSQLRQEVMLLSNTNSTLLSQQSNQQREMIALKENNSKLSSDHAALQREVRALKDKNVIVHQDQAVLTAEKDNMRANLGKLEKEVVTMQRENSQVQSDITQLKADHSSVTASISSVQGDITSLHMNSGSVKVDIDQLKADCTALKYDIKEDMDQLKTDCTVLKADMKDMDMLRADCTALKFDMKEEIDQLKSNLSVAQITMSDLKGDHSSLHVDMNAAKDRVASLEQRVQSAQNSLQDKSNKITALESRVLKANGQVAFHAVLQQAVTSNHCKQTLICSDVVTSVGGGYDKQTGVFTAPVSGTYCFMANTSPNSAEDSQQARLGIFYEDKVIGYVMSSGNTMSTGHTAVKMNAGQRVWMATYSEKKYTYSAGWWTSFSGMLLQPEI